MTSAIAHNSAEVLAAGFPERNCQIVTYPTNGSRRPAVAGMTCPTQ